MRGMRVVVVLGIGLVLGSILVGPLGAQTPKQLKAANKLLKKLLLVDGSGSGLDADTLQGKKPADFLAATGKAADADKLDGMDSVALLGQLAALEGIGEHVEVNQTTAVGLSGTCTNITSCTITNPASVARNVFVQAVANTRITHTGGTDDVIDVTIATDNATCSDPFAGDTASAWAHIDNVIGSSCCFENTISPSKTFPIAAGATVTFFLNGRMDFNSGGALKNVDSANMHCTIVK